MDTRYTVPSIARIFHPGAVYASWADILSAHARAQGEYEIIPPKAAKAITGVLTPLTESELLPDEQIAQIAQIEYQCRHDVVAFLSWLEPQVPDGLGRYLHYGLTSSDLVDTALGIRFLNTSALFLRAGDDLMETLERLRSLTVDIPMLAHTHGQPAEPTTFGLVVGSWAGAVQRAMNRLDTDWLECATGKLSGPVGTHAHTSPAAALAALVRLGLKSDGVGSQITPRDKIARWAASAAQYVESLAKIGLDVRFMATRGETYSGGPNQVGSSSMPHKVNPVDAEQLAGMSRLAAGYAQMLQNQQLWEQRDISHSCVERVAIPDLMHVVLHATSATQRMLMGAAWDTKAMLRTLSDAGRSPYSAWAALRAIDAGQSRPAARETARRWVSGQQPPPELRDVQVPPFRWFGRYYASPRTTTYGDVSQHESGLTDGQPS